MDAARATRKVVNAFAIKILESEIEIKKQLTANLPDVLYKWHVIKNDSKIQFVAFDPNKSLPITLDRLDDLMNSLSQEGSVPLAEYIRHLLIEKGFLQTEGIYIKSLNCESSNHELETHYNTEHPTQLLKLLKSKKPVMMM